MKRIFNLLIIWTPVICFSIFCSSCTHYYYGPNSNNMPLLKEKDDGRVSLGLSGADETTGFELQTSYAFGKHFGAMANYYATGGSENVPDNSSGGTGNTKEKGNGSLAEIGFGYFTPLKDPAWIFEMYGGVGGGSVKNYYELNERSTVGLTRFFVQPSIGCTNKAGTLEAAISTRFSFATFKVKEAQMSSANSSYQFMQIQDIRNNDNIVFFEPAFMIRGGGKNIKAFLQMTASKAMKEKEFLTQGTNTSIGILFSFKGRVKK